MRNKSEQMIEGGVRLHFVRNLSAAIVRHFPNTERRESPLGAASTASST